MKEIGIFYGSTTGRTKEVAYQIADAMKVDKSQVFDVAETAPDKVGDFKVLVLGASTWGSGDLQEDWYDFIAGLQTLDLKGKKIALFGCGDETMGDTFCAAVGELYRRLKDTGAEFIGNFNTIGYNITSTPAEIDGCVVGLLIDDVNHPDLTKGRIEEWANEVVHEI